MVFHYVGSTKNHFWVGWVDRILRKMSGALPKYHAFLVNLGFGHFLSIPFIALRHSLVGAWYERFF